MTIDREAQRRLRISFRLTAQELAALTTSSRRAGLCISGYARLVLLGVKPPRAARRPTIETTLLARTLGELGKIGSNLNQIAHALNAKALGIEIMPFVERDLARALVELRQARRFVLKALGRESGEP